jgi:hypothetical protein
VRTLMRGGTQSLNTSMAKSVDGGWESVPREVAGLPDRVHYHGQPIRVEISGPVHFLHATNMNVSTNSGASGQTQVGLEFMGNPFEHSYKILQISKKSCKIHFLNNPYLY